MSTTISERMAKKAEAARANVRKLLWDKADPDAVADAAIAGGLPSVDVDAIEREVTEGRAAIEHLATFDVPALKEANDKAQAENVKAAAKLAEVEQEAENADYAARVSLAALEEARRAFHEIAMRVLRGELPDAGLPNLIGNIIEAHNLQSDIANLGAKVAGLSGEIKKTEIRAEAVEYESKKLKDSDPDLRNLRMQPLHDEYKATAATMRKQIETGKTRVKEMETELTALQKKYDKAKKALPW